MSQYIARHRVLAGALPMATRQAPSRGAHTGDKPPLTPPDSNAPLATRLSYLLRAYGRIALGTYLSINLVTYSGCYLAVKAGVDVSAAVDMMGLSNVTWLPAGSENLVVAFAVYKLLSPVRTLPPLAAVPYVAKILRR
eukprot:comp17610_c0_seq1/m.17296 comp17610_c0_seq1/g.17296  ORF comp17610_c0_seq1/g.17296 comp17610_c0_seq1/m.17296 type:complete len:138 (-) comp17610_c0_seq1:13-426(-)